MIYQIKRNEVLQMANYTIDNEKKVIIVKMESATDKEMKAIINYQKLGYELVPYKKAKKTDEELAASKYSKVNMLKYLETNGTKEQQKRFAEIQEEIAEGKFYEKDTKTHKKGEPKKKGFIAALKYFKEQFPNY